MATIISFTPDELRRALMPVLEKLYEYPKSFIFTQPVDPILLQIPDYFEVIKHPMDLSTIKRKLITGQYQDPWQFADDVWLMFDNCWRYNSKGSRVYKYCTKFAVLFEQEIDPVMHSLGYCCGRKYLLRCFGKQHCTIRRDANYWNYHNRYTYCEKCFSEFLGDTVTLYDDVTQLGIFVDCLDCGRKYHWICVHFLPVLSDRFTCDNCLKYKGKKKEDNKFSSNSKRKFEIDYEELLLDGKNSDLIIEVKRRKFNCHRCILGARSPVFAAMMEHEMKEKQTGIVTIDDAKPSTFQEFLLYIYTGREDYVNMENVTDLFKLGDKYGLEDLKNVCLSLIKKNITMENFFEFFHLSQVHNDSVLTDTTVQFFLKNVKEIIIKEKWLAFLSENPVESNVLITALTNILF